MASKKPTWPSSQAEAILLVLVSKKPTHQSGNGWRPDVWTHVVKAVNTADPSMSRTSDNCKDKLKYVLCASAIRRKTLTIQQMKATYKDYLFVGKFSGTGWDEEAKHFTNPTILVDEFVATYGQRYRKCFKKSCPFYDLLDQIYDGAKSKATGVNVVHLGTGGVVRDMIAGEAHTAEGAVVAAKTPTAARKTRKQKRKASATKEADKENVAAPVDESEVAGGLVKDVLEVDSSDDELVMPPPVLEGAAQNQQGTLAHPWIIDDRDRAEIAAANAVRAAPQAQLPLGLATGAVQINLGAAAMVWAPIPLSGLPAVYGWDDERVFEDMSDRQVTKWKAAGGPKVFAYVYDGVRHTEDSPVIESIKATLARALTAPAPLVGPAEPRPSVPRSSPFVYLVRNITDAQAQRLLTRFCWSAAGSTVFIVPFAPPSCHFLGSIAGLLFAATTEHANEVAVLVARTIRDSHEAQSYLALVNDAFPVNTDPMAHFLASIRVYALNRAPSGSPPSIIWNATGAPPSHITSSNRAWVRIIEGLSFASDMHYVGEMARPALVCTGCKSLGHERDYCPFRQLEGWEIANLSASSSSQAPRGGAYRRNGRGGGNSNGNGKANGGGRGARGNANGYNNHRAAARTN